MQANGAWRKYSFYRLSLIFVFPRNGRERERERERDIDRVFINKRSRTLSRRRGDRRRINGDKTSMTEFQNEL